eukprot:4322446-Prymnesium_polylepis.1
MVYADALGEVGEYTALIDAIYGHEDHFGVKAGQLVENKMTMPRGPAHAEMRLSQVGELGMCPPGGLAIPRAKIATVIGAMQDVELHELHGVMHMGRTPAFLATHDGGGETKQPAPVGSSKHARKRARKATEKEEGKEQKSMRRGCWRRTADNSDAYFYSEG